MNKTNEALNREISRFESLVDWGGWAIIAGLGGEIVFALLSLFVVELGPAVDRWVAIGADALIAFGVYVEIHFGGKANRAHKVLQERAERGLTLALNRAASAEEELREFRRPRVQIFSPKKAVFVARLSAFKGTQFDAGTGPGGEIMHFWWAFAHALAEAGWVHLPWLQHGSTVLNSQYPLPLSASVSATNVEIHLRQVYRGTPLEDAAKELIAALGEAGIAATDEGFNVHSTNANAIHILVGPKG